MNELIELLKKWAAIEPDKCQDSDPLFWLSIDHTPDGEPYSLHAIAPIAPDEWAVLQRAVQSAIESHDLLFSVENNRQGSYYATVRNDPKGWQVQDSEGAIALLKAYLACLESRVSLAGDRDAEAV